MIFSPVSVFYLRSVLDFWFFSLEFIPEFSATQNSLMLIGTLLYISCSSLMVLFSFSVFFAIIF